MLAHRLYAETGRGGQADTDTWSRTLDAVGAELQGEFEATWARLSAREKRLATAIANNRTSLFSQESQAAYGIAKTGSYRNAIEPSATRARLWRPTRRPSGASLTPCSRSGCATGARGRSPPLAVRH
jgi:hypothetical protein